MDRDLETMILYGFRAGSDYTENSDADIVLFMGCSHIEIKQYDDGFDSIIT